MARVHLGSRTLLLGLCLAAPAHAQSDAPAAPPTPSAPSPPAPPPPASEPRAAAPAESAAPPPAPSSGTAEREALDWYEPPRSDDAPATGGMGRHKLAATRGAAAEKAKRRPWLGYLLLDSHTFVAGRVSGFGGELRLALGGKSAALTLGGYLPTGDLSVGGDFFRNNGLLVSGSPTASAIWITAPTFEPRVFFHPATDLDTAVRTALAFGTSLCGARYTRGRLFVDVRAPRLDLWINPFSNRAGGALSVGAGLLAGYQL